MKKVFLLVDGYNIIFSWDNLKKLAEENLELARLELLEIMCDYQGFKQIEVIIVFDAYKVKRNKQTIIKYKNIKVVYTKERETADMYIERTTHNYLQLKSNIEVIVATSDYLEQIIVLSKGAKRMSANDLKEDLLNLKNKKIKKTYKEIEGERNYLLNNVDEKTAKILENLRLGKGE